MNKFVTTDMPGFFYDVPGLGTLEIGLDSEGSFYASLNKKIIQTGLSMDKAQRVALVYGLNELRSAREEIFPLICKERNDELEGRLEMINRGLLFILDRRNRLEHTEYTQEIKSGEKA